MLDELARDPSRAAVVVDFDGTLAPIVDHPEGARALPASVDALSALVGRYRLVGVVSGRPVDFLRAQLPIAGLVLVGQYGLERLVDGEVTDAPAALPYVDAVRATAEEAGRRWPELVVERKGRLAVGLHWRTAPEAAPHPDDVAALAARHGLAVMPGRMVVELRPPVAIDKGTALEVLVRDAGVTAAAFAGDDHGDLAAFDALDRLEEARVLDLAVRIGVRSEEAPSELLARADLVVDGPAALAEGVLATRLR